jgi:predicted PurR-regulated permease PerM
MCANPPDDRPTPTPAVAVAPPPGGVPPRRLTISISQRTLWLAAGVALVALAAILALTHALGAVLLLFLAITLSEAIRPLVAQLERIRVPRPVGALLIYLALLALLGGIGLLLFNPLVTQASDLANRAPTYLAQVQTWIKDAQQALLANDPLSQALSALAGQALASLQAAVPALLQFPFTLVSGVFGVLLSIVLIGTISVFWLMSADKLRDFALDLAPERGRAAGVLLFSDLGRTLGGWVRGTLVAMLLIGAFTALGLALLGVPYALLLGILAGLLEIIPYLGPWISGSVAVLVALVAVDPFKALQVVALFLIVQLAEGNLVQPLVMSWAVRVDPLLVLIAITLGVQVLGLVGALIAVPVAGMAQVITLRVIAPAIRRATAESEATALPIAPVDTSVPVPSSRASAPADSSVD